jgi:hypothetical protein
MVLEQLPSSFPIITGRTPTDEWDHHAKQVEGNPIFHTLAEGSRMPEFNPHTASTVDERVFAKQPYVRFIGDKLKA